jgi:hypothetical protein
MPPPPPLKDVLNALSTCVLPGAAGAALVMCLFLLLGRRAAALGSAVAVVGAFMWGNFALADPPTWDNTYRLLPWKPGEPARGYEWLPRAALVLLAVGLVSRWLGLAASRVLPERYWWGANLLVWLPRIGALAAVSSWLVLGKAAEAPQWATLRWELAGAMLLVWVVLDGLARDGLGTEASAHLGAALFAGAAVLLYSHNARFMELAILVVSAMFGVATATAIVRSRPVVDDAFTSYNPNPGLYDAMRPATPGELPLAASGAIPAGVVLLVGLVLGTRPSHDDHKVPVLCFWLAALAPAALAPFLIPWVARQNRWVLVVLRVLLILAPLIAAVVLAGKHEKLPFEDPPQG